MYLWSDRRCYYVTEVIDQKHIKVKPYYVCADHDKADGMGHQEWLYFKTWDEENNYNAKYFPEHCAHGEHRDEPEAETWVFRYNKWMREAIYSDSEKFDPESGLFFNLTDREKKSLEKNGYVKRYYDLSGKVSFGVRDYHYDWEF